MWGTAVHDQIVDAFSDVCTRGRMYVFFLPTRIDIDTTITFDSVRHNTAVSLRA